uniref:Indoleamine 2,3-dioxygenase n=1 Tax=Tuber melanosporum TaxID=39416 RepID=G1UJZ9_TUBME|nr:indoleamine 2,3-dioxygenase gamma type [Tuber melanosporum]
MAPTPTLQPFHVLEDTRRDDRTLPAFTVSTTRGFLPRDEPITELPREFAALDTLLHRCPIRTATGGPGLLAEGLLGEVVEQEFPNLVEHVAKYANDQAMLTALYRDYSFLASSYLLEPCHHNMLKSGSYGLGRSVLPENISMPLAEVARLTGFQPFMEYAGSYALYNYRLLDPALGLTYDNLAPIRAFEKGLDRTSSEAGFVLTHVDMVKESPELVAGAVNTLRGAEHYLAHGDKKLFKDGLKEVVNSLTKINRVLERMWSRSKPGEYGNFRTFIFGITGQSMFPKGVIYKGVSDTPFTFRGESGANDSMVPLSDNLLQISMPETPLTDILKDFRKYRPGNHMEFLSWVKSSAEQVGIKKLALEDAESATLYLHALDQVRDFRWRHWNFTREYIIKKTAHPTATGGSPIIRWLPNQLNAVINAQMEVFRALEDLNHATPAVAEVREKVTKQKADLTKEVEKFCAERGV